MTLSLLAKAVQGAYAFSSACLLRSFYYSRIIFKSYTAMLIIQQYTLFDVKVFFLKPAAKAIAIIFVV